jgi:hypothetical protein
MLSRGSRLEGWKLAGPDFHMRIDASSIQGVETWFALCCSAQASEELGRFGLHARP